MKKEPKKMMNKWSTPKVHYFVKKNYKKSFKEKITTPEINKIWNDYVEEEIISNLRIGSVVRIDDKTKIWVKATKTTDNKRAMSLLRKGLMYSNGRIVEANLNLDSSEYIYKIVLETERFREKTKLFFKPHKNLSLAVTEGVKNRKLITRFQCQ